MIDADDDVPESSGRNHAGQFLPGVSGNPAGRPKGSRDATLTALDQNGYAAAERVLQAVVHMALSGDVAAAGAVLKRVWPERKGRPVPISGMPAIATAADAARAMTAVTGAVAAGAVSPEEAAALAGVIESARRAIETADLAERIEALERREGA